MPRAKTKKKPYKKKALTKRQDASIAKHAKVHGATHGKYMKRRMLMGDTMRQAHKKANNR
jgi:hypothetical protein